MTIFTVAPKGPISTRRGEDNVVTGQLVMQVKTSDVVLDAGIIESHTLTKGSILRPEYYSGAIMRVVGKGSKQINPLCWEVTLDLSSKYGVNETDENWTMNPLDRPPVFTDASRWKTVAVEQDYDDPPILVMNTAGDWFQDPLTIEKPIHGVTISVNLPSPINWSLIREVKGRVNDAAFQGAEPETLLIENAVPSELKYEYLPQTEETVEYYTLAVTIMYDEDGWQHKRLNQGFYAKDPDESMTKKRIAEDDTLISATDKNKVPKKVPTHLAGDGTILPEGEDPVMLTFKTHRTADFAALMPNVF